MLFRSLPAMMMAERNILRGAKMLAVCDTQVIDSVNVSKREQSLSLIIADDKDWQDEGEHLAALQEKINAYVGIITEKKLETMYPYTRFEYYIIEVRFQHALTRNCAELLFEVAPQLMDYNIRIVMQVGTCRD